MNVLENMSDDGRWFCFYQYPALSSLPGKYDDYKYIGCIRECTSIKLSGFVTLSQEEKLQLASYS